MCYLGDMEMRWATHIRISNEVMGRLDILLNKRERDALREGVIAPDKMHEIAPHQYPHHYGKAEVIARYINSARAKYIQGDLLRAYFDLGIVLHYIQDSYTSYPSFLPRHQEWEEWIDNCKYVSQIEDVIQTKINDRTMKHRCSHLAKQLEADVQGRDSTIWIATLNNQKKDQQSIAYPSVDYNLGFRASYAVAKSILGPKNHPPLDISLADIRDRFEEKMYRSEDESSRRLIQLIEERDALVKKLVPTNDFIGRIKNWFARRKIDRANRNATSAKMEYFQRAHLKKIVAQYSYETDMLTTRHSGWFVYQVPALDPGSVPTALVDIWEASQELNMSAAEVEATMSNQGLAIYQVEGSRLMKRTDLSKLSSSEARPTT